MSNTSETPEATQEQAAKVELGAFQYFQDQLRAIQLAVNGFKAVIARFDKQLKETQQAVENKGSNVSAETVVTLARRVDEQDKIIAELREQMAKTPQAVVAGTSTEAVDGLTNYLENLVEDLENHEDPEIGAGMIGFFPDTKYPKNTVGYGIKLVLDMLNNMPNALNFGPPEDMDPALHIRPFAPLHIWKEEMTTRKIVKVGDVLMDTVRFGIQNVPDVADDPQVFMPTIVLEPST